MSKYGLILVIICAVDLISTIILINLRWGEASPLLSKCFLTWGISGLVIAKVFMNSCAILFLEVCYRKKPSVFAFGKGIKFYYMLIINLYFVFYAAGIGLQLI